MLPEGTGCLLLFQEERKSRSFDTTAPVKYTAILWLRKRDRTSSEALQRACHLQFNTEVARVLGALYRKEEVQQGLQARLLQLPEQCHHAQKVTVTGLALQLATCRLFISLSDMKATSLSLNTTVLFPSKGVMFGKLSRAKGCVHEVRV
jgi:hypothetical protein